MVERVFQHHVLEREGGEIMDPSHNAPLWFDKFTTSGRSRGNFGTASWILDGRGFYRAVCEQFVKTIGLKRAIMIILL